ncbi:MAG: DUF87 domain-containing protein [Mollicutes bacterium]|nr:DUF87 domain-containing protein [Mollicutes bacterium]
MFGKILYLSDNVAYVENKINDDLSGDLLNLHLIFEHGDQKILGEITEVKAEHIEVRFLGEYIDNRYNNGLIRKASLNSTIRTINSEELIELMGVEGKDTFLLGKSSIYKNFNVYPFTNDLFANHLCIFGNSGSGKSCGVARIVQNILSNKMAYAFNTNLIFFDSFGEYKNAFGKIKEINPNYNYKFITSNPKDKEDELINIPVNLLTVDDYAILLQAEKHSQLTIIKRSLKYANIFALKNEEANKYKNNIIAKALLEVLYSSNTSKKKKDDVFLIINACSTPEFSFDTEIKGLGYSRTFSECFIIDSHGNFGEEVLINEYILKFIDESVESYEPPEGVTFTLNDFAKALEFTLISEGFNQNKNLHDDAQILKVRLETILHNEVGKFFVGNEYVSQNDFINRLVHTKEGNKAQIMNINLESLDDAYAKSVVKVYAHILFEFSKNAEVRASMPFHLFLEEAHRYVQQDIDVFLLGYNVFARIAKEGRKYGVLLNIISQRPVEIDETVVSQCSNFLIFKMTHAVDIKYISEMLPNISQDVIEKAKILQPGNCVAFGSAFKIPMICKLEMPNPRPYSSSCDVTSCWNGPRQENANVALQVETEEQIDESSMLNTEMFSGVTENQPSEVQMTTLLPEAEKNLVNEHFIQEAPISNDVVNPNISNVQEQEFTSVNADIPVLKPIESSVDPDYMA